MERGRHVEEVAVRLVVVGFLEPEGVASEDELRQDGRQTGDLVRVVLGLAAVEDWWVQDLGYVFEARGLRYEKGERGGQKIVQRRVVFDEWRGEQKTLVCIVACHEGNVFVVLTVEEQLAWKSGHEVAVHDGSIHKLAVSCCTNLSGIRGNDGG